MTVRLKTHEISISERLTKLMEVSMRKFIDDLIVHVFVLSSFALTGTIAYWSVVFLCYFFIKSLEFIGIKIIFTS